MPCKPFFTLGYAFLAVRCADKGDFTVLFALIALAAQVGWQVTRAVDPITDKTEVRASLRGDNADMVFSCAAGERPTLQYVPAEFLGGGGVRYALRDFTYRFDSQPAALESWKYLDHYAVPYSTKAAVAFVTKMIQSRKLVVRAERYDGRLIDSTFDLAGGAAAFHEAFEACRIR